MKKMYCLPALKARNPISVSIKLIVFPQGCEKENLCQTCLVAFGGVRQSLACRWHSSFVYMLSLPLLSKFLFFVKIGTYRTRATLMTSVSTASSTKTLSPKKVTFIGPRGCSFIILLLGLLFLQWGVRNNSTHYTLLSPGHVAITSFLDCWNSLIGLLASTTAPFPQIWPELKHD